MPEAVFSNSLVLDYICLILDIDTNLRWLAILSKHKMTYSTEYGYRPSTFVCSIWKVSAIALLSFISLNIYPGAPYKTITGLSRSTCPTLSCFISFSIFFFLCRLQLCCPSPIFVIWETLLRRDSKSWSFNPHPVVLYVVKASHRRSLIVAHQASLRPRQTKRHSHPSLSSVDDHNCSTRIRSSSPW